jgi:predicted Zn-dependent protease
MTASRAQTAIETSSTRAGLGRRLKAAVCMAAFSLGLTASWIAPAQAQNSGPTLIRDTEIEEILRKGADPIFRAAGFDPANVGILLVGDKELNAFATSGLQIGLHTGLILQTETPNELLGVVAHEAGHLAGSHPARSADMMRAGLRPMLLTMGLGVLALLAGATDAGAVLIGNANYFGTLGALGYSREQEGRADQAGAGFLEAAGMSGRGLVDFFDNFRYQEVFSEARRFAYFRSHPISSQRIDMLRGRVEKASNYNRVDSAEALAEHEIMKAKLDGFLNPGQALIKYKEKDGSYPARYARAIAYYQSRQPDHALRLIDGMLKEQPENPYLWELKGQILFEFGRAKEAEAPQRRSVELKPDAPLLRINLGQTLIALDDKAKAEEGVEALKTALLQEKDNAVAWRMMAVAYDRLGQDGQARLATAEYYFNLGVPREAYTFARRAQDLLTKDTPEWRRASDIALVSEPAARQQARRG